jgi:hypothetical protein
LAAASSALAAGAPKPIIKTSAAADAAALANPTGFRIIWFI